MLRTGSILCGGVGSGKSRTSIAYYLFKVCEASLPINGVGTFSKMKKPKDLYIITTARKRDSLEWDTECVPFLLSQRKDDTVFDVKVTIDSWNNIQKYAQVKHAFFIFDEQRVVGSGSWVKNFIKIAKSNEWILLSATPGDTWMDYVPVFIANGFYRNRTEFVARHVVYNPRSKYYQIDRYLDTGHLNKLKDRILVNMDFDRQTKKIVKTLYSDYNKDKFDLVVKKRWNPFTEEPIKDISQYCSILRRIVNADTSRFLKILDILKTHPKTIIFYNYDYELEKLRDLSNYTTVKEWNGHKHEPVPNGESWVYLVQYAAGAEGWNCVKTNTIIFYSLNYSYKIMHQASGRIDRLNTPFKELYYYLVISRSSVDKAIINALKNKKSFNEKAFYEDQNSRQKHML